MLNVRASRTQAGQINQEKAMQETDISPDAQASRRWSPSWTAAGIVAAVVLALLGYGLVAKPAAPPQVGTPVPGFELTALDGSKMSLRVPQGEVAVVNFFASWCAPCRQEAADLELAWNAYRDRQVRFYGIAYKDAESKAQAFLDEFGVSYPSAVDPGNRTARAYGLTGVPETFVVDRQGLLLHHFIGPITLDQLSQEIDRALGY
jgi:cytochrome c biogenesis protein CcmG/thiol:disulfide interchange protein DsbE